MNAARQPNSDADPRPDGERGVDQRASDEQSKPARQRRSYWPTETRADETPEDLIERSMRSAVKPKTADEPLPPFGGAPQPPARSGLDDIAPVYRATPAGAGRSTLGRPIDADGRPPVVWIAVALMAVALVFVAYQCASGGDDLATPANDEAATASDSDDTASDAAVAATDDSEAAETDTTEVDDETPDPTEDATDSSTASDGSEADEAAADDESGPDAEQDISRRDVPPASAASIATTLATGLDTWRVADVSTPQSSVAPVAVAVASSSIWAVGADDFRRYDPANDDWTLLTDESISPLSVVDVDENGDVLRALLGSGDLAPGIGTWVADDEAFDWQFFELPDGAPLPDLVATSTSGDSVVARSDLDRLDELLERNTEASRILRNGGIDLESRWIAGADVDSITYIDPSVPVADWTIALLTSSAWSTFGLESPDEWLAYRPETSDIQRTLQYVTSAAVVDVPDPFGPDEFLLDLQGSDGSFEATTWNGSLATGPTRWTSTNGRTWLRRGPAQVSHRGPLNAADGAHVRAGEHEYRIRGLDQQAVIEYRERDAETWEIRSLDDLAPGLGGAWLPTQVRVGPAGLVVIAELDDPDAADATPKTILLLSRDGTSFVAIDPLIEARDTYIADTYLLVFDGAGGVTRLDPTS